MVWAWLVGILVVVAAALALWWPPTRRPAGVLVSLLVIVIVFGVLLWAIPEYDQAEERPCFTETVPAALRPAAIQFGQQAAQQKAKLTIKDDQKLTLAFGRAREQRVRTVAFTVEGSLPAGATTLSTTNSAFSRDGDDAQIPASAVRSRARVVGDEVQVDVCFDRAALTVDPGSYIGTITIDDPAVATTSVGMTLTFSFPYWSRVIALSLVVAFAASFYVFGLRSNRFTANAPLLLRRKTIGEYVDWVRSGNGLLTIVFGAAAAFTAYSATYLQAEDWGRNPAQVLSLIGAIASGFVAAGTTGRLAAGGAPMGGPPASEDGAPPPDADRPPGDGSVTPPTDEVPPTEPPTDEVPATGAGPEVPGGEPETGEFEDMEGEEAGGPLLDEDELVGHEADGQLEETDEGERSEVGEETSDPERAAAMLADAEEDPEATT
ncbi:MAG TPA: hypothetical protein VNK73_08645 [Actinomycetota bacterium]|nr:hypothetical protein [Actinomycetota bacterium]